MGITKLLYQVINETAKLWDCINQISKIKMQRKKVTVTVTGTVIRENSKNFKQNF